MMPPRIPGRRLRVPRVLGTEVTRRPVEASGALRRVAARQVTDGDQPRHQPTCPMTTGGHPTKPGAQHDPPAVLRWPREPDSRGAGLPNRINRPAHVVAKALAIKDPDVSLEACP
jgi:hypothetical protein